MPFSSSPPLPSRIRWRRGRVTETGRRGRDTLQLTVEVPDEGRQIAKGDEAAVVESVKAASDVYSPVSGSVLEGNAALADEPALVNSDPEGEGWFFKVTLSDPGELEELMDETAYEAFVAKL